MSKYFDVFVGRHFVIWPSHVYGLLVSGLLVYELWQWDIFYVYGLLVWVFYLDKFDTS
jgi:uncharacterized membrane protein YoaK (UPF0700 family)